MKFLGLETASEVCAVGMYDPVAGACDRFRVASHIHSEKLLTLVQEVCDASHVTLKEIDGVAVSIGPGSFTGLRIGLSTAKGLCVALGKPLYGVPTFEAIATAACETHRSQDSVVIVVDARQGDFYTARYRRSGGRMDTEREVSVAPAADLKLVAGDARLIVTDRPAQLRGVVSSDASIVEAKEYCRGSVVAMLGARKHKAKDASDVASIEPVYLKDFIVRTGSAVSAGQPRI